MSTTRTREIVMNQEQLMKVKIKFLEDRINTMEKSIGSINKILGRFQMTENKVAGFEDLEHIKDHVSKVKIVGDHELI